LPLPLSLSLYRQVKVDARVPVPEELDLSAYRARGLQVRPVYTLSRPLSRPYLGPYLAPI